METCVHVGTPRRFALLNTRIWRVQFFHHVHEVNAGVDCAKWGSPSLDLGTIGVDPDGAGATFGKSSVVLIWYKIGAGFQILTYLEKAKVMRTRTAVAIACWLFVAQIFAGIQNSTWAQEKSTYHVDVRLVQVDVQVINKRTHQIVGSLKPDDLQVYEDGVQQQIRAFSQNELPLGVRPRIHDHLHFVLVQ
jgi:hypothetical protein